jgi:protein SSD1
MEIFDDVSNLFVVEQLALAQSSEYMQGNAQLAPPGYVNMGMLQAQQQIPNFALQQMPSHMSPHGNNFQFPQGIHQQQLNVPMNAPTQPSAHRRNQSGAGGSMGPPPPPG